MGIAAIIIACISLGISLYLLVDRLVEKKTEQLRQDLMYITSSPAEQPQSSKSPNPFDDIGPNPFEEENE